MSRYSLILALKRVHERRVSSKILLTSRVNTLSAASTKFRKRRMRFPFYALTSSLFLHTFNTNKIISLSYGVLSGFNIYCNSK